MSDAQNQVTEPIENLTSEAIKAEDTILAGANQDEVRTQVIEKYGLDIDTQLDLIDALVADKVEEHKRLSTAIKQKRSWREKASKPAEVKIEAKAPVLTPVQTVSTDDILARVDERFEQKELDSLNLSDELRSEIKNYAKLNKVSISDASKSPYISFMKSEADKKAKTEDALVGGKRRSQSTKDLSAMTPGDFDRSTAEGRKEYEEWKKTLK